MQRDDAGSIRDGRRVPRSGYVRVVREADEDGLEGEAEPVLIKETLDGSRERYGLRGYSLEIGCSLASMGDCHYSFGRAFGRFKAVAHTALGAAAAATDGLVFKDLEPLLDPEPLPIGASICS